jgi:beta-N-acetylhexosaminidase
MVDLSQAPFHLDAEALAWVEQTLSSMTLDEARTAVHQPQHLLRRGLPGHGRRRARRRRHPVHGRPSATVQQHIRYAQSVAKIPLLVASNPEMGGAGSIDDGTLVTTHLGAGSSPDPDDAYRLGLVGGRETAAIGCNWAFAPIVDIHRNWRNTVIGTRSFGNDADVVIERAGLLRRAQRDRLGGNDEALPRRRRRRTRPARRDHVQHPRLRGVDASYGRVYRELIAHGVQSIMVGHIP